MVQDDRDLVQRFVSSGDQHAFEELFRKYRGPVAGYAERMLGSAAEGEEICVETFLRVLQGRYQPTGSFRGFLFTVAHRLCIDRIRHRKLESRQAQLVPRIRTPEHDAALNERQEQIEAALNGLGEAHRAALLLYYRQGLNSREVAEVLDCDPVQVRSRLSYARRLLAASMTLNPEEAMWSTPMTWR